MILDTLRVNYSSKIVYVYKTLYSAKNSVYSRYKAQIFDTTILKFEITSPIIL